MRPEDDRIRCAMIQVTQDIAAALALIFPFGRKFHGMRIRILDGQFLKPGTVFAHRLQSQLLVTLSDVVTGFYFAFGSEGSAFQFIVSQIGDISQHLLFIGSSSRPLRGTAGGQHCQRYKEKGLFEEIA